MELPNSEPFPGETLRADGWQYRDVPPMLPELWKELMDIIGEGNVRLLTFAERTYKGDDRVYVRGQMFISPAGLKNAEEHAAARRAASPESKGGNSNG